LAGATLLLLSVTAVTGVALFLRRPKRWLNALRIVHLIAGLLTLLFFLLTYLSAPKVLPAV
jgi:hypothetical protein